MNKDDALKRAQELLDYYGSGKYKGYEEVTLPNGRPGIRFTFPLPSDSVQEAILERIQEALPELPIMTSGFPELVGEPHATVTIIEENKPKTERDTHFQQGAKLLWRAMLDLKGGYIDESDGWYTGMEEHPEYTDLIAQFLYDFHKHVLLTVEVSNPDPQTNEEPIVRVPDLIEWPGKPN